MTDLAKLQAAMIDGDEDAARDALRTYAYEPHKHVSHLSPEKIRAIRAEDRRTP